MIAPEIPLRQRIRTYIISDPDEPNPDDNGAESIALVGRSSTDYTAALTAVNQSDHPSSSPGLTGGRVTYGMDCYVNPGDAEHVQEGETIGCQGFATGKKMGCGLSGCGSSTVPGVNMIGTAGVASTNGGIATGVLGAIRTQEEIYNKIKRQQACFHADNGDSKAPLFIATTRNGKLVGQMDNEGAFMTAPPVGMQACLLRWGQSTGDKLFVQLPNGQTKEVMLR